jgi:hypothetical protein
MGDKVTWQDDSTVAQYMWDGVAEQDRAESPGSDGASPYPLGFALLRWRFPGRATESRGRKMRQSPNTCGMMSRSRVTREAPVRTEPHPTWNLLNSEY